MSTDRRHPPSTSRPVRPVTLALLGCLCIAITARAQGSPEGVLETTTLSLASPRTSGSSTPATLELDARRAVAPAGGTRDERATDESWRLRYVRWTGPAASLGVSVGVGLERTTHATALHAAARPGADTETRVAPEVGLRWRSNWKQDRRVDVDAWRSYPSLAPGESLGRGTNNARVELQFRNPGDDGKLHIPRGAFGIQTSANSQWVLRAKRGGPMVYYRARW